MVLVAVSLFPMLAMLTFAIDVSHWFDYSRNLQNRVDASALAGGQMLGACLGGSPGTTANGLQSTAGKWAQLYTGASAGEGSGSQTPNLPYSDAAVAASPTAAAGTGNGPGTGWSVTANGYLNNTNATSPVNSPLTLRAGLADINNYWVALNAANYAPNSSGANTSFTLGATGSTPTFCHSDPTYDATDAECFGQPHGQTSGPCAVGAMVDVKVTQANLPLFIPIFSGIHPTISAHARVMLQGEAGGSSNTKPIAVSDPGAFGCATAIFKNSVTNATIQTAPLTETDPANFVFDNAGAPVTVPMPTNLNTDGGLASVYMQVRLDDCNGNGETFDDTTNSGIEAINGYDTGTPTAGQPPRITSVTIGTTNFHGVTLSGTCTAPSDQYFFASASGSDCKVQPQAVVAFAVAKSDANVTAVDTSTGATLNLNPNNTGTVWTPNGAGNNFDITDSSGQHPIRIDWTQTSGTINGVTCGTGTNNKPPVCKGSFGIQAQAFGACNGCNQPDDSGPIIKSQIRLSSDPSGTTGENSFQATGSPTAPRLVVTLQLAGIRAQTGASAPDVILRFSNSTNHQTGLIDCGQGNGPGGSSTPGDAYTIYGGCGPANPFEPPQCNTVAGATCKLPLMNPLFVYGRGAPSDPIDCSPAVDQNYTGWPNGNHQDCVQTTPGSRRNDIVCGLLQRITRVTPANFQTGPSACTGSGVIGASCPTNHWPDTSDPNDPRKIGVVLTAPLDLAAADGSPQFWIPIRRFATFYVTGWDTSLAPKCGTGGAPNNDTFPGKNKNSSDNGAIWGHWISDDDVGGQPDGNPCDLNSIEPVNCVPALVR
ncbi:MAG TPA: Tad domain-containing protein [Gaiellaceae bacterium]|nr:Tad domain-containing protein [Gaiellaceae bacterium]